MLLMGRDLCFCRTKRRAFVWVAQIKISKMSRKRIVSGHIRAISLQHARCIFSQVNSICYVYTLPSSSYYVYSLLSKSSLDLSPL